MLPLAWSLVTVLAAAVLFAAGYGRPVSTLVVRSALVTGVLAIVFWRILIGAAPLPAIALSVASAAVAAWVARVTGERIRGPLAQLAIVVLVIVANAILLVILAATSSGE